MLTQEITVRRLACPEFIEGPVLLASTYVGPVEGLVRRSLGEGGSLSKSLRSVSLRIKAYCKGIAELLPGRLDDHNAGTLARFIHQCRCPDLYFFESQRCDHQFLLEIARLFLRQNLDHALIFKEILDFWPRK